MSEPEQSIRKMTFTNQQLKLAEYKAKSMGLNFQEYIKYLISKDVVDILGKFEILDIHEVKELEDGVNLAKYRKAIIAKHRHELESLLERWRKDDLIEKEK